MRILIPATLSLLAIGTACDGNSFRGSFDGEPVGTARDAIFDEVEVEIPLFGTYRAVVVLITGASDACETIQEFNDVSMWNCDEACEDLTVFANEQLGQDTYWNLWLTLRADGATEGDYTLDTSFGDGDFLATGERWDASNLYDTTTCEAACQDGDAISTDSEAGESGTLTVSSYAENEAVKGSYEVNFGGGDVLSGRFNASPCDLGSWIWWL